MAESDLENDQIEYFSPSGTYLGQWGSLGSNNGYLDDFWAPP
jgi:hypothetical protein